MTRKPVKSSASLSACARMMNVSKINRAALDDVELEILVTRAVQHVATREGLSLGKLGDDGDLFFVQNGEGLRIALPEIGRGMNCVE